uniref:Uncharacterized protein n=1 Tax=Glossina pallidipes TaxID=7398 RepID=A0A1B0AEN2_GLOPL
MKINHKPTVYLNYLYSHKECRSNSPGLTKQKVVGSVMASLFILIIAIFVTSLDVYWPFGQLRCVRTEGYGPWKHLSASSYAIYKSLSVITANGIVDNSTNCAFRNVQATPNRAQKLR